MLTISEITNDFFIKTMVAVRLLMVKPKVTSDGNTWNYLGKVATADENADYYQFIEPITARYVKFELLSSCGCELYEIYVFK
ncbi:MULTISPECIES: discoidin domain-containing protein [Bacteroides]|uniref:discoidin domain-containing protein n=1 Tax=Bacteroides TaxID=816 RepID=UPI001CB84FE7|nr:MULTISPECIES: discoidin domain-containing protein [Bacteroides]